MLTDAAIKALKPKDKLYKVTDRDGMYVVVNPSGAVVFRYDYRLHGRRETLTLGRYGPAGLSLARAREKLIDAQRSIQEGGRPPRRSSARSAASREAKSFCEFGERWLQEHRMCRKHSRDAPLDLRARYTADVPQSVADGNHARRSSGDVRQK